MDHTRDFARLETLGFKLTKRRREVLFHIAYEPIEWRKAYFTMGNLTGVSWQPYVTGSNVVQICNLMRRGRMIHWPIGTCVICITPFGMEVLLNGIPNKILETDLPIQQDVVLSAKSLLT